MRLRALRRHPTITRQGERTVVALAGEIDSATRPVLADYVVTGLIIEQRPIILDLRDVEFIDLCGVRELARERAFFATNGIDLMVRWPSRLAGRLIHLCGLDAMVDQTIDLRTGRRPPLRRVNATPRSSASGR